MIEWNIHLICFLVNNHHVSLTERPSSHILTADTDIVTYTQNAKPNDTILTPVHLIDLPCNEAVTVKGLTIENDQYPRRE